VRKIINHMQNTILVQATQFLRKLDDDWAKLVDEVGPCALELKTEREPYEALVRAVAYQQLHTKAGDAIITKFIASFNEKFPPPEKLLNTKFDALRACGFSGRKIETIQGIAQGVIEGLVPSHAQATTMSNATLIERLTSLKGIGSWTVEMMLIFTLARQDVLPVDDFGVRDGYKRLKKLELAPKPKALAQIGEAWQPYRSMASWYLWRVPK
jgi:DNA-3-methyladenine glycosylase II